MEDSEKNFNQIKSRIMEFADFQQMSMREFCKNISVNPSNFGVSNLKSSLSSDILSRILIAYPMLSPDWVLVGKGEMLRKNNSKNVAMATAPQSNASNGDLNIGVSTELVELIASQQETINRLSQTIDKLINK